MPRRGSIIIENNISIPNKLQRSEIDIFLSSSCENLSQSFTEESQRGTEDLVLSSCNFVLSSCSSCEKYYTGFQTLNSQLSTFNFQLSTNLTPTLYPKNTATHHPFVLANCPTNVLRCIRHTEMYSLYFQELSSSLMPYLVCRG